MVTIKAGMPGHSKAHDYSFADIVNHLRTFLGSEPVFGRAKAARGAKEGQLGRFTLVVPQKGANATEQRFLCILCVFVAMIVIDLLYSPCLGATFLNSGGLMIEPKNRSYIAPKNHKWRIKTDLFPIVLAGNAFTKWVDCKSAAETANGFCASCAFSRPLHVGRQEKISCRQLMLEPNAAIFAGLRSVVPFLGRKEEVFCFKATVFYSIQAVFWL